MEEGERVRKQSDTFITLLHLKNNIVSINHASKVCIRIKKEEFTGISPFRKGLFGERETVMEIHGETITVQAVKPRARISSYTYLLNIKQKEEVKMHG